MSCDCLEYLRRTMRPGNELRDWVWRAMRERDMDLRAQLSPPPAAATPGATAVKYIYIASPYSHGDAATNVRESIEVADRLVAMGFIPFLPLLNHFWHFVSPHEYEYWIGLGLEWVGRCDAVLRLPGESAGADREIAWARSFHIPVFYSIAELPQ